MDNRAIAQVFRDIADLLNLRGENFFRVRAYSTGAETVENLSRPAKEYLQAGEKLTQFEGIGKDLAAKIEELVNTGRLAFLEDLGRQTPLTLLDVMRLPGVGPKRTKQMYEELDVTTLRDVERAAREGKLSELPRFGTTMEARILEQVRKRLSTGDEARLPWREAHDVAAGLTAHLKGLRGVSRITTAGSYRRRRENVGDLDLLACASNPTALMERFTGYARVAEVVSKGETRSTVRLKGGFQVDLRVVPEESFGAALQYFTGSKAHNIALRKRAVKRGLKLNEYGLYREDEMVAGATEPEIYAALDLSYVEPELRENMGEVEAAEAGNLPVLVEYGSLKGEVRCRTTRSGGRATLEEMVSAAKKRGLKYLAVTEPSRGVESKTGLSRKQFEAGFAEITELQKKLRGFTLLRGAEVAILEDGSPDMPADFLAELDVVIGTVVAPFGTRAKNTRRIRTAMESGHIDVLGHPTGRLLPEREGIPLDLEAVLAAAATTGCLVEINGRPEYGDLSGPHARLLGQSGALSVVTGDARSASQLIYLEMALGQARRGWLEQDRVANTRSRAEFQKLLRRNRN